MKFNGQKVKALNTAVVVIPRPQGEEFVFKAQAVLDYSEYEEMVPQPKPKMRTYPDGRTMSDPNFDITGKLNAWHQDRLHWMVLKSLEATEGLEWETVDMSDPKTYPNYEKELLAACFSPAEINKIIACVTEANSLNSAKIDAATKRFLAGDQQARAS